MSKRVGKMVMQKLSGPSAAMGPSGPFMILSQLLHVDERNEDQLDHLFPRRENFKRCRTFWAENAPVFAVEGSYWGL
jgi:hypothetical protein